MLFDRYKIITNKILNFVTLLWGNTYNEVPTDWKNMFFITGFITKEYSVMILWEHIQNRCYIGGYM